MRAAWLRRLATWMVTVVIAHSVHATDEVDVVRGALGQRLHDHMTKLEKAGYSGVLLVAKDGQVVIAKGYGYANREKRVEFTSNTVFDIGSITKQFTGTAIAKLETQGRLSCDDKLSKYFDNVPADKSEITLHHLLTHSAGLKGDFGGDYDPVSREWITEQALNAKLLFAPGQGHQYANSGFSLLAVILEQVTGQSYEAYLRDDRPTESAALSRGSDADGAG